jgi:PAS domain S-box-containing protein
MLLVEDSEDDALLVVRELGRGGFTTDFRRVETEEELRAALAEGPWDLVTADYHLPRFDALAVLEVLAESGLDVPTIIISGKIGEDVAVATMRAGAHDYVMKDNLARLGPAVSRELEEAKVRSAGRAAEQALRDSETRYRTIVEDQTDFVVRWRTDGVCTFVNRACREHASGAFERLMGNSFVDLFPESEREEMLESFQALTPDNPVVSSELRSVQAGGKEQWTEWVNRGLFDSEGRLVGFQSVGRDITAHHIAREEQRQKTLLIEVLRDTASALNSTLDLDDVFDRILSAIRWVIPHDASAIFFIEERRARVGRLGGWAELGDGEFPEVLTLTGGELEHVFGMMSSGQPVVIQDTTIDPRWNRSEPAFQWVRGCAAAPLFDEGGLFGVLALFCAQPNAFSPIHIELLEGFASQAASATRNARLFDEVSRGQSELRELSTRLVTAQENERARLSRELHDEVGQALTAIMINADSVMTEFGKDFPPEMEKRLQDILALARQTIQQIRGLSLKLRPAMLDELGLISTIRWFTDKFAARSNLSVDLEVADEVGDRFGTALETALYRVLQEALTNVARHAHATVVTVRLARMGNSLRLSVEDDGRGFDHTALNDRRNGSFRLGLLGMRERVTALGGTLAIHSSAGSGTRLEIDVPLVSEPTVS